MKPSVPYLRRYVGNRTGTTGAALAIGTGIWTYSRHRPGSVMDVVPGDAVSSTILLAAAAAVQVCLHPGPWKFQGFGYT
jgi:hypothetical protein